jgi:hypothetical protein
MIGLQVRLMLLDASAHAKVAAMVEAKGAATSAALQANLIVHVAMAIASPQPLANALLLPAAQFERVSRIAVEIETAIGELIAGETDLELFSQALSEAATELGAIAGDQSPPRVEQSAHASPAGTA